MSTICKSFTYIDIYVIGNLDMDKVDKTIKKYSYRISFYDEIKMKKIYK